MTNQHFNIKRKSLKQIWYSGGCQADWGAVICSSPMLINTNPHKCQPPLFQILRVRQGCFMSATTTRGASVGVRAWRELDDVDQCPWLISSFSAPDVRSDKRNVATLATILKQEPIMRWGLGHTGCWTPPASGTKCEKKFRISLQLSSRSCIYKVCQVKKTKVPQETRPLKPEAHQ